MSRRTRRATRQQRHSEQAPVVLAQVLIVVTETGVLDVTLDGAPYRSPSDDSPWTRDEFGDLLDAVTRDRTVPARVEVRETDGSVFTDILQPRPSASTPVPVTWPVQRRGRHAKAKLRPSPVEITADGFTPGENVAVAVVLTHARASSDGTVAVLLDRTDLSAMAAGGPVEVVLCGRVSNTLRVQDLP